MSKGMISIVLRDLLRLRPSEGAAELSRDLASDPTYNVKNHRGIL